MNDEDLRQAWERGKPLEADRARRAATTVLSLRLPDSVMEELTTKARNQGKAAGTFARELIESALAEDMPVTPTTLASMFRRWVGEALVPRAMPTFDLVFASRTISNGFWVSQEKLFASSNYEFAESGVRLAGFEHPDVTSRTVKVETEPAGENAA